MKNMHTADPNLQALIAQVNAQQKAASIESDEQRAWIVPDALWRKLQSIALLINSPDLAKTQRDDRAAELRRQAEWLANDPADRAESQAILDFGRGVE